MCRIWWWINSINFWAFTGMCGQGMSAARCTQQFCWCTQQIMWKDLKAPQNFFKKITLVSLSLSRACFFFFLPRTFLFLLLHSCSSFFCFILHLLLRAASSSQVKSSSSRFCFFLIFVAAIVVGIKWKASSLRCCFFFKFLLLLRGTFLLRISSSSLVSAMAETAIGRLLGSLRITWSVSLLRIKLIRNRLTDLDP